MNEESDHHVEHDDDESVRSNEDDLEQSNQKLTQHYSSNGDNLI